jgi:hypothetical protein
MNIEDTIRRWKLKRDSYTQKLTETDDPATRLKLLSERLTVDEHLERLYELQAGRQG